MKKSYTRIIVLLLGLCIISSPLSAINVTDPSTRMATVPDAATVKAAVAELNSLSKKEKKQRFKEVKKAVKDFKAKKKAGERVSDNTLLLVILAILLPPLAVYLHEGTTNNKFWISLILTLLFWVPGVIYALVVVLS